MPNRVEPIYFTTVGMEQGFQDATRDIASEPALESFLSVFAAKKSARTMSRFDREKLKTQSTDTLERVLRNLNLSLDAWRHDFHNQFNDALKYIMNFNEDSLKLCNADLKRLSKRKSELKRALRAKGNSPEQMHLLEEEQMKLDGMLEDLSKRIRSLNVNLVLPEQMGVPLIQVMGESKGIFDQLIAYYAKYERCLDAMNDPSDLRYGTMKLEKLSLEMEGIADGISNGGEIRQNIEERIKGIQNIVLTKIYNQDPTPNVGNAMEIVTQDVIGKPLIQTYDKSMALLAKTRKRLKELGATVSSMRKGGPSEIPISMIVTEIVFSMTYFNMLGDLLNVYFSAPLSIAKAKATK